MEKTEGVKKGYVNFYKNGSKITELKTPQDCKYFHNCSANLCPLDLEISKRIWIPSENDTDEICRNSEFSNLQFIKTQKKIRRTLRNREKERDDFFTYGMLNRNIIVRTGIMGIFQDPPENTKDPMAWYAKKEREWISNHPEIKLSKNDIQKLTSRFKKEGEVTL